MRRRSGLSKIGEIRIDRQAFDALLADFMGGQVADNEYYFNQGKLAKAIAMLRASNAPTIELTGLIFLKASVRDSVAGRAPSTPSAGQSLAGCSETSDGSTEESWLLSWSTRRPSGSMDSLRQSCPIQITAAISMTFLGQTGAT